LALARHLRGAKPGREAKKMSAQVGFEIDFLPVGEGERSGDAIALRYGLPGAFKVMVVDGGTKASGEKLVEHIRLRYDTNHVDYLVNTHPDADHASGLEVVLENMTVGQVWLHRPWNYPEQIIHWFGDGRITVPSLAARLQDAMTHAYRVEELALQKHIPIYEPFTGSTIGEFHVLSPTREWYMDIIAHFDKTPETTKAAPLSGGFLMRAMEQLVEKVQSWVDERLDLETLSEDAETSFDNESSVILYAYLDGKGIFLTGDAGVQALTRAADLLNSYKFDIPTSLSFIQIPHHGSRHNVNPTILNRLLGPIVGANPASTKYAFVSAGAKSSTHPRRIVTNAFKRRGWRVYEAKGNYRSFHHKMPVRGWPEAPEVPFYDKVES
jgi:beta-lactamase superfamily II metal-dependent hydrolase